MEEIRWAETLPALKSVQEGKTILAEKVFSWKVGEQVKNYQNPDSAY